MSLKAGGAFAILLHQRRYKCVTIAIMELPTVVLSTLVEWRLDDDTLTSISFLDAMVTDE